MARGAATKKRRPPETQKAPRSRKEARPKTVEETLFFNRLRGQAKWVFVFLALIFGLGFVIFGVGSDIGGGLSDIFRDGSTGNGTPSINKALRQTQDNPKNPQAWADLGRAYELDAQEDKAIEAWTEYTELRPKQAQGYNALAQLYETKASRQTDDARRAAFEAQAVAATDFTPPSTSPLGRALADQPNRITQSLSALANERYNRALQERAATLGQLVTVYGKLAEIEPEDANLQLQLASAAQNAGNAQVALDAYERYLELVDADDPQVPFVKQQINTLKSQLNQ